MKRVDAYKADDGKIYPTKVDAARADVRQAISILRCHNTVLERIQYDLQAPRITLRATRRTARSGARDGAWRRESRRRDSVLKPGDTMIWRDVAPPRETTVTLRMQVKYGWIVSFMTNRGEDTTYVRDDELEPIPAKPVYDDDEIPF